MIKIENWCGHSIRFIEQNGEWWAILKDICDALNLRTDKVSSRLDPDMLIRVPVEIATNIPSRYSVKDDNPSKVDKNFNEFSKTVWMLAVNEVGIYEALYASRRLEARKFRRWSATVMQKLRKNVGLKGYEVMRMTDKDIQDRIDDILDTLYYDEETGILMQSVTVAGGDVDHIPFEEEIE